MNLEQKQKQGMSHTLIYATAGSITLLIVFGAIFLFNIGNVRSALAGSTTTVTWEGKQSADWNDAKNWVKGKLPDNGDNIAITEKYKYAPVISENSKFNIYDLNISEGAKLEIKAKLEVKDDITLKGSGSTLILNGGSLDIGDHIYIQENGAFVNENGSLNLKDDLSINEGSYSQKGDKAEFYTADAIELSGKNCYFRMSAGKASTMKDLAFESNSAKGLQRFSISGGKAEINGYTRFYKTDKSEATDQMIEVSGGYLALNEISREGSEGTTYPANFIFKVSGGELHFNKDLVMDQFSAVNSIGGGSLSGVSGYGKKTDSYNICEEEKIKKWNKKATYKRKNTEQVMVEFNEKIYRMITGVYWSKENQPDKSPAYWEVYKCVDLCSVSKIWDSEVEYERKKGGDQVFVLYEGNIYELGENVWWSKNHLPDEEKSKYWKKVGKCYEWSQPKCGTVDFWNSKEEYRRKDKKDKIEVSYDGYVYSLKENVWYSKNDKPDKKDKVWTKGDKCESNSSGGGNLSTTGEDEFIHEDGLVVFNKKWIRPDGFETKGDGVIKFKNTSDTVRLKAGDKYKNLVFEADAKIALDGDVQVMGNLTNNSTNKPVGNYKIKLTGTSNQLIAGSVKLNIVKLDIDKSEGEVYLDQHISISHSLTFSTQTVIKSRELSGNKASEYAVMTFEDGASWQGEGWVEGKVRKIGTDEFTFPTGKNGRKGYIGISAPASSTTYDAEYFVEPYQNVSSVGTGLINVSRSEYWSLDQMVGSSDVEVTLYWADGTWSSITDETELLVASWSGTEWETLGHDSHTGNTTAGSITNASPPSAYNFFTFGSNSNMVNALPVELLYFRAKRSGLDVVLNWATAEEINNDYFEIHRSTDGYYFETIATIKGQGNASGQQDYSTIDMDAPEVLTYYRMKQVDFNGNYEYKGGIVSVLPEGESQEVTKLKIENVGPNPFVSDVNINFSVGKDGACQLYIISSSGNIVYEQTTNAYMGSNSITFNGSTLEPGYYVVRLMQGAESVSTKIIKNR